MKTSSYTRPSYVRTEIGSWFSFADEGNAKGEIEVTIAKENGGSNVDLSFHFNKEYSLGLSAAAVGAFSLCLIGLILNILLITSLCGIMTIALVLALEERAVFGTKKRFMQEFNMLMQLLSTK